MRKAVELEAICKSRQHGIYSPTPGGKTSRGAVAAWFYKCQLRPWMQRLAACASLAVSAVVVWSEATIGTGTHPDLSPFSLVRAEQRWSAAAVNVRCGLRRGANAVNARRGLRARPWASLLACRLPDAALSDAPGDPPAAADAPGDPPAAADAHLGTCLPLPTRRPSTAASR